MTRITLLIAGLVLALATPFAAAEGPARTIRMEVNGLVCAFCAHGIKQALSEYPAADEVHVDLENRLVAVALADGGDISDADLNDALTDAGYTVVSIARTDESIEAIKAAAGGDGDG
jgi:mercuric ion binding protein